VIKKCEIQKSGSFLDCEEIEYVKGYKTALSNLISYLKEEIIK